MIRTLFTVSLLTLGSLLVSSSAAPAQVPFFQGSGYANPTNQFTPYNSPLNPLNTPPISPWINLGSRTTTNSGTSSLSNPAAAYFLGVIPEQQRRADQATFGAAIQNLYQRTQTPAEDTTGLMNLQKLPPSGHTAAFQYYGTYYSFPVRPPTFMPYPAYGTTGVR
jgi:hypothetical protein